MRSTFLSFAARVLNVVRDIPLIHRPVHAVAVAMTRTTVGARLIRAIIEPHYPTVMEYGRWTEAYDTLSDGDRQAIAARIEGLARRPLISVVMPTYNTDVGFLRAAIESVRGQLYDPWELCIADDASPDPAVWEAICGYVESDPRIKAVRRPQNGHISATTNSALKLATGEFVVLMDHDDILAPQALYEIAAVLNAHPDADLIYSDEDKLDAQGRRSEPYFKTAWNPELMLGQNMVSHLGAYRRGLVEAVGGLRLGLEGSQDYDLALRVSAATIPGRIHHIPAVLYHWRHDGGQRSFSETQSQRCADAAKRAVEDHLVRTGQTLATVTHQPDHPGWLQVKRAPPSPAPLVSVIVPTRDRADLLAACVDGVLEHTSYPNLELLIMDNGSVEPETQALFARLKGDARVRVISAPGPFNFADLNNQAAQAAKGEILLLLNNDISMIAPDWLDELVGHAVRPEVGAVGARLLYPDGKLQHGGVALGIGGDPPVAGHLCLGARRGDTGYYGHLAMARNVSAVTAACMALRREVYLQVGGMDAADLKVAFNDVDMCLKIRAAGYDIVWTPFATLYHHESASRGLDADPVSQARFQHEIDVMRARWGEVLDNDPFFGPNFDADHGDYRLASPPRRVPTWRQTP